MMQLTIWGSRGSHPASGRAFEAHGGDSSCYELVVDGFASTKTIIIDAGTGLARLGMLAREQPLRALLLQTHLHWDHLQGFPFFAPLYDARTQLQCWGVCREGCSLREALALQMQPPSFPIALSALPAQLCFHDLAQSGSVDLQDDGVDAAEHRPALRLSWAEMSHPSGCTAYRIEDSSAAVVFSGDVELQQGSFEALRRLACNAQVLVMDAQYFPEEYATRRGFGHSTMLDAVDLAIAAGVQHLLLCHHDPQHVDARLRSKLELARAHARGRVQVDNAFDGMSLEVGGWRRADAA